jgi:hypothetical protein
MNAETMEEIMGERDEQIAPYFRGVYSLNEFVDSFTDMVRVREKNVFVFNSEPSNVINGHWLLMYFDGTNSDEKLMCYFDSFAKPPAFYNTNLAKFVSEANFVLSDRDLITAPYQVQSLDSRICGVYVVFCARGLLSKSYSRGRLVPLIDDYFSPKNRTDNDRTVVKWISRQSYGPYVKNHCINNDCVSLNSLLSNKKLNRY